MNCGPTACPNLETSPISQAQWARLVSGCCPRRLGSRGFKRGENPSDGRQGQSDRCCLSWVQDSDSWAGRDISRPEPVPGRRNKGRLFQREEAGRGGAGRGGAAFHSLCSDPSLVGSTVSSGH